MASLREDSGGLSKAWAVRKKYGGLYSGGKVDLFRSFHLSDERPVLAAMYAEDVSLVDVSTGEVITTLRESQHREKHGGSAVEDDAAPDPITTFALNPKTSTMVTASRGLLLRQWALDMHRGENGEEASGSRAAVLNIRCIRSLRGHAEPMLDMTFDSTGSLVATGSADRTARVWDMRGGFATHNFRGHAGIVNMVQFHPDSARLLLVTGSEDCSARVWSLHDKSCVATLGSHMSAVTSVAFTADGMTMATGSRDKVINFWELRRYSLMKTFPVYEEVEGLCISSSLAPSSPRAGRDGSNGQKKRKRPANGTSLDQAQGYLVCVGSKGVARVWHFEAKDPKQLDAHSRRGGRDDLLRCTIVTEQPRPNGASVGYTRLVYHHRENSLIAVNAEHNLLFMDLTSLVPTRQIVGYTDEVIQLKYLEPGDTGSASTEEHRGKRLAVATNSPKLKVLHVSDFSCDVLDGHDGTILSLDVSPSGRWVVTGSKDRTCRLWDVNHLECVMLCVGHTQGVSAVALSKRPGGYSAGESFAVSGSGDRTIKRWGVDERSLSIRADGSKLTSDSLGSVENDPDSESLPALKPTAERNVRAHEKDINHISIAPNDAVVATASQDRTVKLWSADLDLLGTLRGHKRGVMATAFSPANRSLVTCSGDRTVKIWSIADLSCLKTFQGHSASVLGVEFLAGGLQVVSSGADGLVKLWTVRTNECEATFDGHADKVWALALSKDGNELATGGADSLINIWDDVTKAKEEELLTQAEERVLKEHGLLTSIYTKDYTSAVELAFELGHSYRLWGVLSEIAEGAPAQQDGSSGPFDSFIDTWDDERIVNCLEFVREWNTNVKNAAVAQALLDGIFRRVPYERLKRMEGLLSVINAIIPYSERHYNRIDNLVQSSFVLDYTLAAISAIDDGSAGGHGEANGSSEEEEEKELDAWPDKDDDEEDTESDDN